MKRVLLVYDTYTHEEVLGDFIDYVGTDVLLTIVHKAELGNSLAKRFDEVFLEPKIQLTMDQYTVLDNLLYKQHKGWRKYNG